MTAGRMRMKEQMSTTRLLLALSLLTLKAIGKECAAPGTKLNLLLRRLTTE